MELVDDLQSARCRESHNSSTDPALRRLRHPFSLYPLPGAFLSPASKAFSATKLPEKKILQF